MELESDSSENMEVELEDDSEVIKKYVIYFIYLLDLKDEDFFDLE